MSNIDLISTKVPRQKRIGAWKAYSKVNWARRNNFLAHPSDHLCADCGARAEVYDHRDYNKPLDVTPVCSQCNVKRGPAIPAENDDPAVWHEKDGTGYVLSVYGVASIAFTAVDFFPVLE